MPALIFVLAGPQIHSWALRILVCGLAGSGYRNFTFSTLDAAAKTLFNADFLSERRQEAAQPAKAHHQIRWFGAIARTRHEPDYCKTHWVYVPADRDGDLEVTGLRVPFDEWSCFIKLGRGGGPSRQFRPAGGIQVEAIDASLVGAGQSNAAKCNAN